jgi:hypothetical protein
MSKFANSAETTIAQIKSLPWTQAKSRCQAAAFHNQTLLAELARIWSENRSVWLQQLARDIR